MLLLTATIVLAALTAALPTPADDPASSVTAVTGSSSTSNCTALDEALDTPRCQNPIIRKSFYALSKKERKEWTSALVCLQNKPSRAPKERAPGARTRFDDFNAVHIIRAQELVAHSGGVHMTGSFHAWHRYFIYAFETALRNECGYRGAQPYWDWSKDADSGLPIDQWEVWNADYGVGGNGPYVEEQPVTGTWPYMPGQTGGGCVLAGPFVNYTVNVGPGDQLEYNPHCLRRGLNPDTVQWLRSEHLVKSQSAETFLEYDDAVQGQYPTPEEAFKSFHSSGHYSPGGDSTDFISSTSEPIFWMHHGYMDYLYWNWQKKDPVKRLSDIAGGTIPFDPTSPQVTLDDGLDILWEGPIVPIRDTMDIRRGILCYEYE